MYKVWVLFLIISYVHKIMFKRKVFLNFKLLHCEFRQTKFIVQSNVAIRANPALIIHLKHSAQSINCITVGTSQTGSVLESKIVPCLSLANSDIFNVI